MISVKHFGAKVDGGTNDTTAITNAEALSGITELFIPEGTCIVTSYVLTKQYRGPGFISVDGTVQPQNADWEYAQSNGNRSAIRYFDGDNIYVTDKSFTMSEFRVQGQYTRLKAPAWDQPNDYITASIAVNRFGSMSATRTENWHAAFACANQGDAAVSTQTVPFLRARSVAGSVITLGDAGVGDDELGGLLGAYTYTWTPSELVGLKVLVISEGVLAGKTNILGSRVTTITAATATTITLADIGSIGARDWILPAPSGFNFFRYLGTFNVDILEVSNIYDDGRQVGWLGSANLNFTNNYTGSQPAAIAIKLGGYISPLATAVMLYSKYTLSTASTGDIFERFGGDISHLWDVRYDIKNETSSRSVRHNNIPIPFFCNSKIIVSKFNNFH